MVGRVSINRYNRKEDFLLSRLASLYFIVMVANYSLKTYFKQMPNIVSMINTVMMGILVVTMFSSLIKVYKGNKGIILNSYFLFGLLLLVGCLLNANNGYSNDVIIRENAVWNLALWIPLGCIVCAIQDKTILYKHVFYASFIIDLFLAFSFFTREVYTEYGLVSYNMSFGTYSLLPILLHINEFLKTKNKILLILLLLELYAVLVYGNRGIFLSIAFFFFAYYVIANRNNRKSVFFVVTITLLFIILVFLGDYLLDLIASANIESRTIQMLLSGNLAESTERDELRKITMDMIKESPIIGWGFGGEYYEIAKRYGGAITGVNSYFNPHNGILQNLVEFGIFLGMFATILLVVPLFKIRRIKEGALKDLLVIFGASAIIPKLISAAGFFTHPEVAVFVYLYYFRNRFGKVDVS